MNIIIFVAVFLASQLGMAMEGTIEVNLGQLRNDQGVVRCAVWASAAGYPANPKTAIRSVSVGIKGGNAACSFQLPPGTYAVSAFHDENANGLLDSNWLGIPKEGLAASNNAKGAFGPPAFEDAAVTLGGALVKQAIEVVYL